MTRIAGHRFPLGSGAAALAGLLALACTIVEPPEPFPLPAVFTATPNLVIPGEPPPVVTVAGRDFVPASRARIGTADRPTEFIDENTLTVALTADDVSAFATLSLTVVTQGPGGGTSGVLPITVGYPVPVIASVLPDSALVQSPSELLTITGTGFHPLSEIRIDGLAVATTFVSATEVRTTTAAANLATGGVRQVRVANPGPGAISTAASLTVLNRVPEVTLVSPDSIFRDAGASVLAIAGHNFVSSTTARLDGALRSVTFVDSTTIHVALTVADAATLRTASLVVASPAPGGGQAASKTVRVIAPLPTITQVSPSQVPVGGSAALLTVTGTDFAADAVIQIDGVDYPTIVTGTNLASTDLAASEFISARTIGVRVRNVARGTSTPVIGVPVVPPGPGIGTPIKVTLLNRDVVADPVRDVLYASVPGSVAVHGNRIVKIDVATGSILGSVLVGNEPAELAVSDDGQYLYVGLNTTAAVARIRLSDFQKDLDIFLPAASFCGGVRAEDLEVIPGAPTLVAISLKHPCSPRHYGVTLYSGDVRLPLTTQEHTGANRITTSAYPGVLYGYNNETTEFGARRISVAADGLREVKVVDGAFDGFDLEIEHSGDRIWSSNGRVINAATFLTVGTIPVLGPVRPDTPKGRVHFLVAGELRTYSASALSLMGTAGIADAAGLKSIVRFGTDGLAFGGGAAIVIVRGALIGP